MFAPRHTLFFSVLEHGSPLAVKAASFAVSALLVLLVAVPVVAVGARIVA